MNDDDVFILAELDIEFEQILNRERRTRRRQTFKGTMSIVFGLVLTVGLLGVSFWASILGLVVTGWGMNTLVEHGFPLWRISNARRSRKFLEALRPAPRDGWY